MRLYDVVSGPWAITPDMFAEVQGIYTRHCRGEKIDVAAVEAKVGAPLNNARSPIDMVGSVAVISIEGVLAKRANLLMRISGGASTQIISEQLAQALADDAVSAIVLAVDSPGGTVDGTQALSDQIYAARGTKPICAVTDGMMCSAAYWIASAADKVYIGGDTTQVGSIGVIATHVDKGMAEAQAGVRVTEITAGKQKGVGSPHRGLGSGEVVIQATVDHYYDIFTQAVARNRGVSVEEVKQDMAEGQIFLGQQAIDAGLVDGVATLAQVIANVGGDPEMDSPSITAASAGAAPQAAHHEEETMDKITIERVRAEAPDIAAALIGEGAAKAKAEGIAEGAAAERARIQAVEKLSRKGCEALVSEMKYDGKTSGPEAAVRILGAIDAQNAGRLADMQADAGKASTTSAVVEHADPDAKSSEAAINPREVGNKAAAYRQEQAQLGNHISEAEAVGHVMKGVK